MLSQLFDLRNQNFKGHFRQAVWVLCTPNASWNLIYLFFSHVFARFRKLSQKIPHFGLFPNISEIMFFQHLCVFQHLRITQNHVLFCRIFFIFASRYCRNLQKREVGFDHHLECHRIQTLFKIFNIQLIICKTLFCTFYSDNFN